MVKLQKQLKKNGVFILLLVLTSGIWIYNLGAIAGSWSPIGDDEGDVYLVSNDIIKNFRFETFDGDPITLGGQLANGKMQFESQASWRINPDDIVLMNAYVDGDDVYIRYKVAMSSKINIYTTNTLVSCAKDNKLNKQTTSFLVAKYSHHGLFGHHMWGWDAHLDWTHYDFGDIHQWNGDHNVYSGDLKMSFDIAQSPLPDFQTASGNAITKNFDYIAVSSMGVVSNVNGLLDDSAPNIVGLTPDEYETADVDVGALDDFGKTSAGSWDANYDPMINLHIFAEPQNVWGSSILPQTAGSDLHPTTKGGDPIWNPEAKQSSMPDCEFIYHVGFISPLVKEYYGRLTYQSINYQTIDECNFLCIGTHTKLRSSTKLFKTETRPVALHVTNRYIQTEVKVVFDVFTSYNIDVGADGIEDYDLEFPAEYYDLLTWITTVDGFGGGEQYTSGTDFLGLGGFFGSYGIWIIVIVVIVGLIVLYLFVIRPMMRSRQQRKLIETALGSRGSTRPI